MPQSHYSISELAEEFGITTRAIRFYEEKGLIHPARRGQRRLYTAADRVRIQLILRGKRVGMTLRESVELIDLYDPDTGNANQLQALLDDISSRRERLLQQRRDIDDMLAGLNDIASACQDELRRSTTPTPMRSRA